MDEVLIKMVGEEKEKVKKEKKRLTGVISYARKVVVGV